jgi:hypothetical protein
MSLRFSVFKTKKPKQFEYKPLYYDPVKEELMQRVNAIKKETGQLKESTEESDIVRQARITSAFQNNRSIRQNSSSGLMQNQTVRIAIIATILAAIAYYIIK